MFHTRLVLLTGLLVLCSACVGKKKHLEALQSLETKYQTEIEEKTTRWTSDLQRANSTIGSLELRLAERKGENNALVAMQDKLEGRIERLKQELENQGVQSQSTSQNLREEIRQKEATIQSLRTLQRRVNEELEKNLTLLGSLANDVQAILGSYPEEQYAVMTSAVRVKVALSEKLLFRRNSTSTVSSQADALLSSMALLLERYPSMDVVVMGHTDNRPPRNKAYKDNWNVSSIRAAIITRQLVDDYDVSPNQILAAGKGEFAPMASNETSEGRASNRRIELRFQPRQEDLIRVVQQILGEDSGGK
ncbi:MAG: OmpA family protein [Bacteroidota bacterium]